MQDRRTHDQGVRDARQGGLAMIAGTLMGIAVMSLHPTGHDVLRAPDSQGLLALVVHATAIAACPVALYGSAMLARWLRADDRARLAELALVFSALSAVATLLAATASGFLAPALIGGLAETTPERAEIVRALLRYNTALNGAFARILVGASAAAILLWSVDGLRTGRLGRNVSVYGVLVATFMLAAIASGRLPLDVHGFGLVVLLQGVWTVLAGLAMRRGAGGPEALSRSGAAGVPPAGAPREVLPGRE